MKQKSTISKLSPVFKIEQGTEITALFLALGLLFIISFVYFLFFGRGIFIYQENKTLFIYSEDYLKNFLSKPGGLLEYAGNFLIQGYHYNAGGALLNSLFPVLLAFLLIKIFSRLSDGKSFLLPFILFPTCLFLLLETHYEYFIHQSLGFLVVLWWFLVSVNSKRKSGQLLPILLFPLLYYLAGAFAAVFFGMYFIYSLVFDKRINRFIFPVISIITAFLTFFVFKEILFLQPVSALLRYPVLSTNFSKLPVGFWLLCGYLLFIPLFAKASTLRILNRNPKIYRFTTMVVILPVTLALLAIQYDREKAYLMQFEKLIYEQDWCEVIRMHENSASKTLEGQYFYNLALSEEGKLCDRLFFAPQDFGTESLFLPVTRENVGKNALFYYCIGLTGEALHLAYESMVIHGYQPENLKLIVKLELINGNYKVADRYINLLGKTLFYRKWAEQYQKMLFNRNLILADKELGGKLKFIPEKDFFVESNDEDNLDLALLINPLNKRAFEYKMASLLLKKNFRDVVYQVKKMKNMGYESVPRHIEEAVVFFKHQNYELPYFGGLDVNPETVTRFREFETVIDPKSDAAKKYKNTFWFYMKYR